MDGWMPSITLMMILCAGPGLCMLYHKYVSILFNVPSDGDLLSIVSSRARTRLYLLITSVNCVLGIASAIASCFNLLWVACSYANEYEISLNSLKAVPMKAMQNGRLGPTSTTGLAGLSGVSADRNPSGTDLDGQHSSASRWDTQD